MRETIDGAALKAMVLNAAAAMEQCKKEINELNVFPVPDGDTGTNMCLTLDTAAEAIRKSSPEAIDRAADIIASATLRGARGNSGVILSLLFRGISKGLKGRETADASAFAGAMAEGVEAAYKAVMKPAEGTILTVSRLASKAAMEFADAGSDIELMLVHALETAKDALKETVNQNPVLKRAGVIDAGGKGYVVILSAMLASLQGRVYETAEPVSAGGETAGGFGGISAGEITFTYCTEFIVEKSAAKPCDLLRAFVESIGDSAVVVDDEEIVKVHVHTNEPGRALSEALRYGSLLTVKVENMREQHSEMSAKSAAGAKNPGGRVIAAPEKKLGAVAVCAGEGMEAIFRDVGADRVVAGGQTMNPSTEDILSEIDLTPSETVFVFPNNKNIIMAAEQCVRLSGKKVVVIPTVSVAQGVAALLALEADGDAQDCERAMLEVIENVHTALITYAARDSEFDGHDIKAGEYLALIDGKLLGSHENFTALLERLAEAFTEYDPEFITVYYGQDVSEEQAMEAGDELSKSFGDAEVSVLSGGQPIYYYIISAE